MTNFRYLDDQKRGYPLDVGGLLRLIRGTKTERYLALTEEQRKAERDRLIDSLDRISSDQLGAHVAVLDAVGQLAPGQVALLKWKVRR